MITTTPNLKELAWKLLHVDLTLYDAENDPDASFADTEDLEEELLSPTRGTPLGGSGEATLPLPVPVERVNFVYKLLKQDSSSRNVSINKTAKGKLEITGQRDAVDTFREIALGMIVNIDSQTKTEYSPEGAKLIYEKCFDQVMFAFKTRDIDAAITLKGENLVLLATDAEELEKARGVFNNVLLRQSFTLSKESFKATQEASWNTEIQKLCNPPRIHVYVNDSDGGPHVVVEGLADNVSSATAKLLDWLKENATTTVRLELSTPIWRLLRERVKDSLFHIVKGISG